MDIKTLLTTKGFNVITNSYIGDATTVQIRNHKKKRINKKYRKRYGTKTVFKANGKINIFDNCIIVHPDDYKLIEKILKKEGLYETT